MTLVKGVATMMQGKDKTVSYSRSVLNLVGGVIATGLVCILAYVTYALINSEVPEGNVNALLILIGILSANISQIVNFFFGSSVISKQQTDIIDKQTEAAKDIRALAKPETVKPAIPVGPGEEVTVVGETK